MKFIGHSLNSTNTVLSTVEINKDHPNEKKQKLFTHSFAVARESTIMCIWQIQRQAGEWKSFIVKKGSPDRKLLAWESWRWAD